MAKKRSKKFWAIFWLVSIFFLTGWYFFWQTKNHGMEKTVEQFLRLKPNRTDVAERAVMADDPFAFSGLAEDFKRLSLERFDDLFEGNLR